MSHGCVRLSLANPATLWGLVKRQKMANTTVMVTGDIPGAKAAAAIAAPKPANPSTPFPRVPAATDLFSLFHQPLATSRLGAAPDLGEGVAALGAS